MNQNISIDWEYAKGSYLTLKESSDGLDLYSRYAGDSTYNYTVVVFAIDKKDRSHCWRRSNVANAIFWFKDNNGHSSGTLAHETFHAFGAEDLYYEKGVVPIEVEQNFKKLLGDSIMITSNSNSPLDPINAWLIGWNKKPEPWFAWFFDKRNTSL